jgi:hypothetical protein
MLLKFSLLDLLTDKVPNASGAQEPEITFGKASHAGSLRAWLNWSNYSQFTENCNGIHWNNLKDSEFPIILKSQE